MSAAQIAPVFNSFRIFRNIAYNAYMRMPKCAQYNIGSGLMKCIINAMVYLRQWEEYYNNQFKLQAVQNAQFELKKAGDFIEWMVDERMLSVKQCAQLVLHKEDVERQLGGIRKSLEKSACQM